ncbi:hypothetical protein VTP01DRAFT_2467 [Rhizomucor pusillus]|uniref:uncharacterized protein n=1 Tax=Rhizomucor pusillus TaxID=4840 RepID=UPI0037449758
MYFKNTDETYIKLDPVVEPSGIADGFLQEIAEQVKDQQQQLHNRRRQATASSSENIFLADKPDSLFAGGGGVVEKAGDSSSHSVNSQQPVTRPDKMIELLTDGLVRLSLHRDGTRLGGDNVTPWRNYGDFVRWSPEPPLPSYYTAPIDMPSRQVQEHLINVFFTHCNNISPIISRSMFFDQLNVKGPIITPLLLNIMYAHAAKHVDDPSFRSDPNDPSTQGNLFYNRARRLVDDFMDIPRVSTVIALLYMASYDYESPYGETRLRSSRAWMYSGMAVRMCLELGLHTANYSSQMSQFDIDLRKRVLWTCYVMDKLESCMTERPWMLRAKDISLDFPTPLPEDDAAERCVLEGFGQLCRLLMLVEKVIQFFAYDNKGRSVWTMEEENQTLRFLDEIQQWRENLPASLKWSPSDTSSSLFITSMPASAIVANLHLVAYDLELSLVMCSRFQDERLHRERRRALANTITHLVNLTVTHPRLMYTFALSAFSGIFAALTHASEFDHPVMEVAQEAKMQFRKSLESVRAIVERIPIRDMRNFARLVDLTLQPTTPNSMAAFTAAAVASSASNGPSPSPSYANAFTAISDLCNKDDSSHQRVMTPSPMHLFASQHDMASVAAAAAATGTSVMDTHPVSSSTYTPLRTSTAAEHSTASFTSLLPTTFAFNSTTFSPSTSSAVSTHVHTPSTTAAAAAAAATIAATTAPASSSTPIPSAVSMGTPSPSSSHKNIEPADYTFELISVADEWARSLMYQ